MRYKKYKLSSKSIDNFNYWPIITLLLLLIVVILSFILIRERFILYKFNILESKYRLNLNDFYNKAFYLTHTYFTSPLPYLNNFSASNIIYLQPDNFSYSQ